MLGAGRPSARTGRQSQTLTDLARGSTKAKRLTIDLDPELHKELKRAAVDEGTDMVSIVRELIAGYVARSGDK